MDSELNLFLENKSNLGQEGRFELKKVAEETLKLCKSPNEIGKNKTILCMGYVQSGKTTAFEAVMALGKDKGYKLFIVLAGISNNLLGQSSDRIELDFRINSNSLNRRWVRFTNPDENSEHEVLETLSNVCDEDSIHNKAVIITILKHKQHIENLAKILSKYEGKLPTLIIDDEADQASLNNGVNVKVETEKKKKESATYKQITNLRGSLPHHNYLQYTATPQAPLLIDTFNQLSPDNVLVLEPGKGYVGGKVFFQENSPYIVTIDKEQLECIKDLSIPEDRNSINYSNITIPSSYLNALQVYVVGLAIDIKRKKFNLVGNRSMLVHPDRETKSHTVFTRLTEHLIKKWKKTLVEQEVGYMSLLESFRSALHELQKTCDLRFDNDLDFLTFLKYALKEVVVKEVNATSGKTPQINWSQHYAFILVGGMALDRGFTVEGLTVTYMPRSVGVGHIDSVQQRGRFFGYKENYLDICRIYIDEINKELFEGYVVHEEAIRKSLIEFSKTGKPLTDWIRIFWLSPDLKACRKNVINAENVYSLHSSRTQPTWFYPNYLYSSEIHHILEKNKNLVNKFLGSNKSNFSNESLNEGRKNEVTSSIFKLKYVYENLLIDYRNIHIADYTKYHGWLLLLDDILRRNPNADCYVYNLTPSVNRKRSMRKNGTFAAQQGGSGNNKGSDKTYMRSDLVTIHLSSIDTFKEKEMKTLLFKDTQVVSIRVPETLEDKSWFCQLSKKWHETSMNNIKVA